MKNLGWIVIFFSLVLSSVAIGLCAVLYFSQSKLTQTPFLQNPQAAQTTEPSQTSANGQYDSSLQNMNTQFSFLQASVSALQTELNNLKNQKAGKPTTVTVTKTISAAGETSLFLGSGQTNNRDWTTLPSAAATVDLKQYGNIKEIWFEAGLGIIGGEAHARLIDLTTGQPLYSSEVFASVDAGQWVSSNVIMLPATNHTYAVQLRSSSGEMAYLIGARLRIVTK